MSLLLLIGANGSEKTKVEAMLKAYIQWTTTGECPSAQPIFADRVRLSYKEVPGKGQTVAFAQYSSKIAHAAHTIPRTMRIKSLSVTGDKAKAVITDCSEGYSFELLHHLTITRGNHSWKILEIIITGK